MSLFQVLLIFASELTNQWRILGGRPTDQKFLNSMQLFGNFGKIVCCRTLHLAPPGWRLDPGSAPANGGSWIRPC